MRYLWWALVVVGTASVAAAVNELWPRCETDPGVRGLAPPETTCTSHPAVAVVLLFITLLLVAVALRMLSARES